MSRRRRIGDPAAPRPTTAHAKAPARTTTTNDDDDDGPDGATHLLSSSTSHSLPPPPSLPSMPKQPSAKRLGKSKAESCAECRRLKLKCSRTWPCTNCIRRNVKDLCPNGSLAPSSNLRSQKSIKLLLARIAALENALTEVTRANGVPPPPIVLAAPSTADLISALEADFPSGRHHLATADAWDGDDGGDDAGAGSTKGLNTLSAAAAAEASPDKPHVRGKRSDDESRHEAQQDSDAGLLSVYEAGETWYIGRSGAAILTLGGCKVQARSERPGTSSPAGVSTPAFTFPAGLPFGVDPSTLVSLPSRLPSRKEAERLVDIYMLGVDWMYRAAGEGAVRQNLSVLYGASSLSVGVGRLHPHHTARLLMVFALGKVFDVRTHSANKSHWAMDPDAVREAQKLFTDAAACLSVNGFHFLAHQTLACCETLHLMVTFLFIVDEGEAPRAAWPLLGFAMRLGQAMGLHKDATKWPLDKAEVKQRARMWWEIMVYDRFQSLNFGRPYMTSLDFVDAKPPEDRNVHAGPGPGGPDFHHFKYLGVKVFGQVSDLLLAGPSVAPYEQVMALDAKLHAFEASLPPYWRLDEHPTGSPSALAALRDDPKAIPQRHMLSLLAGKAILFLHRPFFSRALEQGQEPLVTPYADSFSACVTSARRHMRIMESLLRQSPRDAYLWWFFVFHAFSAAAIQALVLIRTPLSMLARDVRQDFELSYALFCEMAPGSKMARRALPMLETLRAFVDSKDRDYTSLPNRGNNALADYSRPDFGLLTFATRLRPGDKVVHAESPAPSYHSSATSSLDPTSGASSSFHSNFTPNNVSGLSAQSGTSSSAAPSQGEGRFGAYALDPALEDDGGAGIGQDMPSVPPPLQSHPSSQVSRQTGQRSGSSSSSFATAGSNSYDSSVAPSGLPFPSDGVPSTFRDSGSGSSSAAGDVRPGPTAAADLYAGYPTSSSAPTTTCWGGWSDVSSIHDVAALFAEPALPDQFATPVEWTHLDPLVQSILFWHPAQSGEQ